MYSDILSLMPEWDNTESAIRWFITANTSDDYFKKLASAKTAQQKFAVTLTHMKNNDLLPRELKANRHHTDSATSLRNDGNKHFLAKRYVVAVDNYTKSLMNTNLGSVSYAYALANRSAAFFHMGLYEHCLKDIGRVFECGEYPVELRYKLSERSGNAHHMLGNSELAIKNFSECLLVHLEKSTMTEEKKFNFKTKILDAIKKSEGVVQPTCSVNMPVDELLGGKNENIPSLSKYLEIKWSEDMGRGVYATCDINPGDVLVIDDPYIGLSCPGITFVCNYTKCLKRNMAVIPCPKCSIALYCDYTCMNKANEDDGHHLECLLMYSIRTIPGIQLKNFLVMKWFLRDCSKMGVNKFCTMVNDLSKTIINPKTKGFDVNGVYNLDNFLEVFSSKNINDNLPLNHLCLLSHIAVEMMQYMKLSGFKIPYKHINAVGASLTHMLDIITSPNRHLFTSQLLHMDQFKKASISLNPIMSLFNHSCDANLKLNEVWINKTLIWQAVQPIPKGSQLFVSYFAFDNINIISNIGDREFRSKFLMDIFQFKCCCQPCLENWPLHPYNIPNYLSPLNILNKDMTTILDMECKKFEEFGKSFNEIDLLKNINYLHSFLKLLFYNVKRPFALYEICLKMVIDAHSVDCNIKASKILHDTELTQLWEYFKI